MIAGAAIDVFWGDPTAYVLPAEDELWDLDNLLITSHNATGTDRYVANRPTVMREPCQDL
jgi:phosphoglycerate dehydrogenase-like enzyme